jgi:hypothetical protein
MNSAAWWWAAGASPDNPDGPSPGPGPGFDIPNSLRFRDAITGGQTLRRTQSAGSTEYTVSFWSKHGAIGKAVDCILYQTNSSSTGPSLYINHNPAAGAAAAVLTSSDGTVSTSPRKMRDPSAWYHIVYRFSAADGNRNRVYVNGELWADVSGNDKQIAAGTFSIGANAAGPQPQFEGYMADFYFIDGQALEPTAFGRENDNGVWVPREVDFTPAEMRLSDFVTGDFDPTGTTTPLPALAFDGSTDTRFFGLPGGTCQFAPEPAIEFTGFRVFGAGNSSSFYTFNGTTKTGTSTSGAWIDFTGTSGQFDADTPLIFGASNGSNRPELNAIEITDANGTRILTNPFIWSNRVYTTSKSSIDWNTTSIAGFAVSDPGGYGRKEMFNGDDIAGVVDAADLAMVFRPAEPIENITTLQIQVGGGQYASTSFDVCINGSDTVVATINNANANLNSNPALPVSIPIAGGTLTSLALYETSGSGDVAGWAKLIVNGQVYLDGVNNSFGVNGFHLDFADPDDLGKDSSGNGNDFTATGFNTDPVGVYSTNCFSVANGGADNPDLASISTTNTLEGVIYPPANGFDGGTSNAFLVQGSGSDNTGTAVVRFNPPLENITQVTVFQYPGQKVAINSTQMGGVSGSGDEIFYDGVAITLESVAVWNVSGSNGGWYRIGVTQNGSQRFLVNNTGTDYDLMQDSPTQNYATLNAIDPTAGTLTNANLTTTSATAPSAPTPSATILGLTKGDYYFEFTGNNGNAQFDITTGDDLLPVGSPLGAGPPGVYFTNNLVFGGLGGNSMALTPSVPQTANWNWAIRVNIDDQEMSFWANGISQGTYTFADLETALGGGLALQNQPLNFFGCSATGNTNYNFGQQPFIHTPPAGTVALQTQNLPAAPIPDGRDHFQAITGPGQGYLVYNEGGDSNPDPQQAAILTDLVGATPTGAFATSSVIYDMGGPVTSALPGFQGSAGYWVTSGTPAYQPITTLVSLDGSANSWTQVDEGTYTASIDHFINISTATPFRYVRMRKNTVNSNLALAGNGFGGILGTAQQTFPNGLWWIKDRVNTNQHQLVDSVTNAIFGGNKANTLPTNSQAIDYVAPSGNSVAWCWNAADPATSGFNIVQYTGQNPTTTAVPHGLGKAPDMIFTFAKSGTTRNPAVYLSETGPSKYFILSNPDGAISDSTIWANTAPDETNFYVGSANTTNFPGATFVAYCWTAIPGYSAFGSYTGNGDPNGPVIVTGFRPAFILTKRATADEDWSIVDTTRSIDNPAFQNLRPNQTNGEGGGIGSNDIDILSNGFKLRNNTDRFNSTGTYVYACFAENPFGASNTSPATAR